MLVELVYIVLDMQLRWRSPGLAAAGKEAEYECVSEGAERGRVSEEVGDELVIYDEATQVAHSLSKDAASVWRLCDGHRSAEDVAYRVGLEQARVAQALDELSAAGLMQEPDGISRRALYKRAAKLGAATLAPR